MRAYRRLLGNRRFRLLWIGSTVSEVGDGAAWIALSWTVYSERGSARDLGLLFVFYTAPVVVGGPLAGVLLDRFDRRRLLIADNALRSTVMAAVPLLYAADRLELWHLYTAAALYGLLKMFPLAGVPALLPDLVDDSDLDVANAMETIGYTTGVIAGPAIGGAALTVVAGPYVLAFDALSYLVFALALVRLGKVGTDSPRLERPGLRPALRVILRSRALLATTVMFMFVNVGEGIVAILLPVYAAELGRGAGAYGALVAAGAAAGLLGALLGGSLGGRFPYGRAIALSELAAGVVLLPMLLEPSLWIGLATVGAGWFFLGPLTVWAQTLRMREIPAELRGRVFGTLRTAMQGAYPLGGVLAPPLLAGGGLSAGFLGALLVIALPGLVGLWVLRGG